MRLGRISIGMDTIKEDEQLVRDMFMLLELIPVEIHHDWAYQALVYTGLSPRFEDLSEGTMAQNYNCQMLYDDDNGYTLEVVKETTSYQ